MSQLLDGVRVLEAAMLLNGSTLGLLLGDMGADVIKLEQPGTGDYLREFLGQITPHHSPPFMECNKNKRSLSVNLRTDEGREIFFELLKTADVFVDGYLEGACEKMGIGYEQQKKVKPDIIYAQYTGWGATGPWAKVPTHGGMMMALAGASPVSIDEDGNAQRGQRGASGDVFGGTASGGESTATGASYMAANVAAALYQRSRTGEGAKLDGSGADAVIASGHIGAVSTLNADRIMDRATMASGQEPSLNSKYTFYRTKDDKVALIAVIEHKFWANLCKVAGREDLIEQRDESKPVDWGTYSGLREEVAAIMASKTLAEWMDIAVEHDIAIGPANSVMDLLTDPQIQSREIIVETNHPNAGKFYAVGTPVMVAGQPYEVRYPSPELGEHNDEILAELGRSADDIAKLRDAGAI
jgi:crotonobetainyl-CoA:carnitine CoA-transferase CaiB-like acyl-CoA transferase